MLRRKHTMYVTDPIADMLTRIRNGQVARKEVVDVPASNMVKAIANILLEEGYVKNVKLQEKEPQSILQITLKNGTEDGNVIRGLKKISKPGLRVYAKKDEVPKVLGGLGIAILYTSKGIMTDKKARSLSIGGEVLAFVW